MTKSKSRYQGKPRGPRWPLLTAIAVLHVLGLYALSRLLAPDFTASVEKGVADAFTVIVTTPPDQPETAPEPDEGAAAAAGERAEARPVSAPTPELERNPQPVPPVSSTGEENQSGARDEGDDTGAAGDGFGPGSGNSGNGSGNGIAVRPSVRSGSLDPRRDFPVPEGGRQARFGTSVTVYFTVMTDGKARDCSVSRSTSDAQTTALVCDLVIEKIRFNPARNADGDPVEARYGYRVDFRAR